MAEVRNLGAPRDRSKKMNETSDRFRPPAAPITDVALPGTSGSTPRPGIATVALILISVTIAFMINGDANRAIRASRFDEGAYLIAYYVLWHGADLITLVFAFRGRRWARTALVIMLAWTALMAGLTCYSIWRVTQSRVDISALWPAFAANLVPLGVRIVATAMLYSSAASAWFKLRSTGRAT
jgi:hypothetical protein